MRTRTALIIALALLALAGNAVAQPASDYVSDIAGYIAAMKSVLAESGIEVTRIDSPGNELLVVYKVTQASTQPEFALGAVLCVAQPLAQNAQFIRARNVENGRRLLELTVPPGQLKSSLLSHRQDLPHGISRSRLHEERAFLARNFPDHCPLKTDHRRIKAQGVGQVRSRIVRAAGGQHQYRTASASRSDCLAHLLRRQLPIDGRCSVIIKGKQLVQENPSVRAGLRR